MTATQSEPSFNAAEVAGAAQSMKSEWSQPPTGLPKVDAAAEVWRKLEVAKGFYNVPLHMPVDDLNRLAHDRFAYHEYAQEGAMTKATAQDLEIAHQSGLFDDITVYVGALKGKSFLRIIGTINSAKQTNTFVIAREGVADNELISALKSRDSRQWWSDNGADMGWLAWAVVLILVPIGLAIGFASAWWLFAWFISFMIFGATASIVDSP